MFNNLPLYLLDNKTYFNKSYVSTNHMYNHLQIHKISLYLLFVYILGIFNNKQTVIGTVHPQNIRTYTNKKKEDKTLLKRAKSFKVLQSITTSAKRKSVILKSFSYIFFIRKKRKRKIKIFSYLKIHFKDGDKNKYVHSPSTHIYIYVPNLHILVCTFKKNKHEIPQHLNFKLKPYPDKASFRLFLQCMFCCWYI